jgi:hypothetical protein
MKTHKTDYEATTFKNGKKVPKKKKWSGLGITEDEQVSNLLNRVTFLRLLYGEYFLTADEKNKALQQEAKLDFLRSFFVMTTVRCSLISKIKGMQGEIKKGRKSKDRERLILVLLTQRFRLTHKKQLPSGQRLHDLFANLISEKEYNSFDPKQNKTETSHEKLTLTVSLKTCSNLVKAFNQEHLQELSDLEKVSDIDAMLNDLIEDC